MKEKTQAVMQILTEIYGDAKPSLSIGETRGRKDIRYFYRVRKEEKLLMLLDYLRGQIRSDADFLLEGLRYDYDETVRREDVTRMDMMVRVKQEREDLLTVCFFPIEGVRFRRLYGSKPVATVTVAKDPVLELWLDDEPVVFSRSKSGLRPLTFQWWINKCLRNSEPIRTFVSSLLMFLGKAHPILKDVSRTIREDHFFFPPLSYPQILDCRTPAELIEQAFSERGERLLPIRYNKTDINVAYYLTGFAARFDEKSVAKLIRCPRETLLRCIQPQDLYEGPGAERFLLRYYMYAFSEYEPWEIRHEISDYIGMCERVGEPLQLFSSYTAFLKKHDELADAIRQKYADNMEPTPLIPENSRFRDVSEFLSESSDGQIEWIQDARRLYLEGTNQHNCVFYYEARIREDDCAILHMDRSGESYTIRIEINFRGQFYIAEMRAKFNKIHRRDDFDYVVQLIRKFERLRSEDDDEIQQYNLFGEPVEDPEPFGGRPF